jgi:hypothetical protein
LHTQVAAVVPWKAQAQELDLVVVVMLLIQLAHHGWVHHMVVVMREVHHNPVLQQIIIQVAVVELVHKMAGLVVPVALVLLSSKYHQYKTKLQSFLTQ